VGRLLLAAVLEDARRLGVECVTILVRPSNVAAIGLYRGIGFRVIERRPGHYADREDALKMAWSLEPARVAVSTGGATV
jgi:ribosomal-protein-alanine N-acetyltransferase